MPTSLEACRLLMIVLGLAAIPLALVIEWLYLWASSRSRSRLRRKIQEPPVVVSPTARPKKFVVKVTPRIKGIH